VQLWNQSMLAIAATFGPLSSGPSVSAVSPLLADYHRWGGAWHTGRRLAKIRPPQPTPEETSMLTMEKTADYVKRWVAAFESKDLDRVLAFYTNDVIFHSPLIARLSHDPSGTVQGKAALRAYVKKGFEVFDHIKFTVLDVLRGVDSIAIHYKGITGTHVIEVLFFDKDGMVRESYVHYASA
jgi:ketosteroid isomerase-like protein